MDIRKLRQEQGISQKALAEKMGVSVPTISRWEKEPEKLKQSTCQKLMEIFGDIQEESGDVVNIKVEVPKLTSIQAQFMSTMDLKDLSSQVNSLGYINYVLRSNSTTEHYYRALLLKEWEGDTSELV